MIRVLFVDDEVSVLDGLRDRLRKQRHRWEMVFANGGQAALVQCASRPFDVVVSDMRMPGMDGATLLEQIKMLYPSTARIVLSGHADRDAILRALPVAHQYLSKPCDAETICRVIEGAYALRELMDDPKLRAVVGRVDKLPSVPTLYAELTSALGGATPSIDAVARIIERDPAMCIKLLQVVNSSFFRLARRVTAAREAIVYLGIEPLKALVLATQIFSASGAHAGEAALLHSIQKNALIVAQVARKIARSDADDAFTAGLLHDIGIMVFALADGRSQDARRAEAVERRVPLHVVESERLGVTHAEVGAYLLGTWGLPIGVVQGVAGHHDPARRDRDRFDTATAVHVASALVEEGHATYEGATQSALDEPHLANIGVAGELAAWRALVQETRQSERG